MAGRVNIDYTALERFEHGPEVTRALKKGADAGRDVAMIRVANNSYDSGHLFKNIKSGSSPGKAWFGTDVKYAQFLEFGTRYMAAEPFMRPAFDAVRSAMR